jgi:hypothetical protein
MREIPSAASPKTGHPAYISGRFSPPPREPAHICSAVERSADAVGYNADKSHDRAAARGQGAPGKYGRGITLRFHRLIFERRTKNTGPHRRNAPRPHAVDAPCAAVCAHIPTPGRHTHSSNKK